MSTTTPNLGLFKYDPSTDGAQTFNIKQGLNDNWDKIDAAVKSLSSAAEYSSAQTYALGDYCTHDGKLYRCTTAITEAEAWTEAHWTETSVTAELIAIYTTLQNKADTSSVYSKEESISASTRTALSLPDTATPDNALSEIARQLSESGGAIESAEYPGCYYRMVDDVVEWLNPPMLIGVEYRTTERYNSKPIYCQLVSFGTLSNSGVVYVEITGMDILISASGTFANNRYIPQFCIAASSFGFDRAIAFTSDNDSVGIMVSSSISNGTTAYGFIKYTRD